MAKCHFPSLSGRPGLLTAEFPMELKPFWLQEVLVFGDTSSDLIDLALAVSFFTTEAMSRGEMKSCKVDNGSRK